MYDDAFAWSSLWILHASWIIELQPIRLILVVLTAVSFAHWTWYREGVLKNLDMCISSSVFVYHVALAIQRHHKAALVAAFVSMAAFWINTLVLRCRARDLVKPRAVHLIPHGTFRLFAYWMLLYVHECPISSMVEMTIFYWSTLYLLWSIPHTGPSLGGWRVTRRSKCGD